MFNDALSKNMYEKIATYYADKLRGD